MKKLSKEEIEYIENSDAVFIIAVKGISHITIIDSEKKENNEAVHKLTQAMLGAIKRTIDGNGHGGLALMLCCVEAYKIFPKLFK